MPTIRLTEDAVQLLSRYPFPGNIRQLRNIAEQLSVIETERSIDSNTLKEYLPHYNSQLPSVIRGQSSEFDYKAEREMMYNIILELRKEIDEVKQATMHLLSDNKASDPTTLPSIYYDKSEEKEETFIEISKKAENEAAIYEEIIEEQQLTIQDQEIMMIKKSLEKNRGKRKLAAKELGISERTLYRKIKQYDL